MRAPWSVVLAVALPLWAGPGNAEQGPLVAQARSPQRPQRATLPPVVDRTTVVSPAEGEVVTGDLAVVLEVPSGTEARSYSLEVAYLDPGRNAWVYPGLLGSDFAGGPRATHRVTAAELTRFSATATQWQLRARVTDPPGSWGPWRTFTLGPAPTAPATMARSAPAGGPTTMGPPVGQRAAVPDAGGMRASQLPAVQGREAVPPGVAPPPPVDRLPAASGAGSVRASQLPAVQGREAVPPGVAPPPPVVRLPAAPGAGSVRASQLPAVQGREAVPTGVAPPPPVGRQPAASARPPAVTTPATPAERAARLDRYRAGPGEPTTRLKLWNGIGAVDKNRVYVDGPVDVDWERKDLKWWFEYRVSGSYRGTGPLKLRWELSRAPFPAWGEWKPLPGFGLAGPVETAKHFQVDLSPLAPRPPGWVGQAVPVLPAPKGGAGPSMAAPAGGKTKASPHPPDLLGTVEAGAKLRSGAPAVATPGPLQGLPVAGAPGGQAVSAPAGDPVAPVLLSLHLRVVPVDASGAPVGRPSRAVELRFGPPEQQPAFTFDIAWPEVAFSSYRPVRPYDFDWQCWVVASQDVSDPTLGVIVKKGQLKNLCEPENTNFLDDIVDTFGGFLGMLTDFVDWLSHTYASLKSGLISAVASAIGCSDNPPCQTALTAALDAGLAAVGMPPSLPDFDQLQAMGEGYLVDVMAQQAAQTGIPFAEDAAEAALKEMIAQGKEAMTSGGGGSSIWIPDAKREYKPLLVTVQLSNPLPKPTAAVYLEVAETGSTRYLPQKVFVPPLAPQRTYKIAVALEPTQDPGAWMDLLPTAADYVQLVPIQAMKKMEQAKAAHAAWSAAYQQGHVKLRVSMRPQFDASTGYQVPFEKTCQAGAPGGCLVQ